MSLYDIAGWVGTGLQFLGAYQVTVKKRIGFLIYAVSCIVQIPGLAHSQVWYQVFLLTAFIVIDIIGFFKWGKT